jgi:pilus assembly protein CpaB
LKPEQVPVLAAARQAGTLSLSLRSIADANQAEVVIDDRTRLVGHINVVRYGVNNPAAVQK